MIDPGRAQYDPEAQYRIVSVMTLPAVTGDDLYRPGPRRIWYRVGFPRSALFTKWNSLRHYGPSPKCRFDPQPPPAGEHPGNGVIYLADSFDTAVVETFNGTGTIEMSNDPVIYAMNVPLAGLRILDLRSGWSSRTGLWQQTQAMPPRTSRLLARRIRDAHPDLAGLAYRSARHGRGLCLVLWEPARDAMNTATLDIPQTGPLASTIFRHRLNTVANRHGLVILP